MDTLATEETEIQAAVETQIQATEDRQTKFVKKARAQDTEETEPFTLDDEVIRELALPIVVRFSVSGDADTECTLQLDGDNDRIFHWPIPDFMTDSLFADFLTEIVDAISDRDTKKFLQFLQPSKTLEENLQRLNRKRQKWFFKTDDETSSRVREIVKSIGDIISPYPQQGKIKSVDVHINNETDPTGELRENLNQTSDGCIAFYPESEAEEETEEDQDATVEDKYPSDEEEEIDKELQANPEKPCYYPSQIEMAAILKKRIDTIMFHYHKIARLSDAFNDVEFVVYTARYRMLSDQTEKRIRHPDAGVLSKEELEARDDCYRRKRMFMYVHSTETEKHFQELKRDVKEKPETLFVIIADECHWGITKDKEERKPSAHNLFVNEWCKENSPPNVVVVQISATPFNLLTQNSRLPVVRCVILNDNISTIHNDYKTGDLVVLEREPNLEEHVKNNLKEIELHVVHWSEVELKNFERGMRMKLRSALNIEDAPYQYLHISADGKLGVTSIEDDANDFIVQGSNGIVILNVVPAQEQQQANLLTVSQDAFGNLEAKFDPQKPTKFEVKLDFGVGVVAFCSHENQDHYIAVNEYGYVSLLPAKVEWKCGVAIMKPPPDVAEVSSVSYHFFIDRFGPAEVDLVGKQYMSLNFYLSTMNSSDKNEQKIREDHSFQKIVDKAKRHKSKAGSPSFSIDALLCAEYCYYILHVGVYQSDEKIRQALTSSIDDSPAVEFDKKLNSFVSKLKNETTNPKKYIEAEAFEFVRNEICKKATDDFKENLKHLATIMKQNTSKEKQDDLKEVSEELATSFVACLMHLSLEDLQKIKEYQRSVGVIEEIKQTLQENNCQEMLRKWKSGAQESETSSLVENLIQSGKENMGKMKIVRAKSMKTANQFYSTLRLARTMSCFEECFEVIRDYGGIQIENQLMKSSSPFFKRLQPKRCTDKFDCCCSELNLEAGRRKCTNCQHVHKVITQYEDLENLACVLILVDKGRMGDTFPQSFDCLDLRLNYDNSSEFKEGSLLYLSTVIQELGRMCRYSKSPANASPYVLVGRALFKKLQDSMKTSPSMSAISCNKADRYMTKSSARNNEMCSSLRWLDYEAHKDSYDYQNVQKHCNRILLQAEPQIGKTGTYLCLIRDLRLDILGKEKGSLSSAPTLDEGFFYHDKECHLSEEVMVSEMEEMQDWQYPYWKTIQDSKSLIEKPVASGKYSIGGCFYTHDMEESPYILMNLDQQEPTKSGHQHQTRECADGIRAWHWYHFETCAECGRLLQGKEPVLETFEINVDGETVAVECSIPSSQPSFKHLLEQLKNIRSTEEDVKKLSVSSLPYWIFHASHRDDPRKCTLNYHHVMQEDGHVHSYVQIAVVRSEKFEAYRSTWGKVLAIVKLPKSLTINNCKVKANEGGVGYARLIIQKMAFALNQEYIFMIDDNVVAMSQAVFSTSDPSATAGRVVRDENGVMQMERCSFLKPLTHLQKIVHGKDIRAIDERTYEPHPLTDEFKSQEVPLYTYTGPAKLFGDKQHESYGILGLIRSIPVAVNPFSKTQVYAAVLLNVKSTVEKGVFYRPWPCWEDLRFNDDCDKAGLWVVKCNCYSFLKVQYKDWINNLALPTTFEWKDDSILEERPLSSELPKDLEEGIILDHLRNFVNIQGPEKCFKGCIGYDPKNGIEDIVSPKRMVKQVEVKEGTEEDFANGIPILSYCVTNSERENLNLLDSRFRGTKEKIIFVASAREAIEEWPQMSLATIPTKKGICLYSEMRDRNAQFAIFSAADPKRHRLRYILIEASFQEHKDDQEEIVTKRDENSLAQTENERMLEESTSSHDLQPVINEKKRVKRSLPESLDDSIEIKRRKTEDFCSQRIESLLPRKSDEGIITEGRCSQDSFLINRPLESSGVERKQTEAVAGGFEHIISEIDYSEASLVDSVHKNEEIAEEKMDFSDSDGQQCAEADNGLDVSVLGEDQVISARKRDARNGNPAFMEGTNDVTKVIVDLWRECRNRPGSSKKDSQEPGSSDLPVEQVKEKLEHFTTDQLQETDEKGYTAVLKACSLPSMSPHVMQYLIITRKVDLNCQLPHDFDRNHSATEGLIPGMSALSVAIKSGNVKSVSTFTRRRKEIAIQSADDDGNTALHHCVLSISKFSFQKLFPLVKNDKKLKWKKMRNKDGKNALEIAKDMKGLSEGNKKTIALMITEMKQRNSSQQNSEKKSSVKSKDA